VVLYDADHKYHYIKRFQLESDLPENKLHRLIGDNPESRLILLTDQLLPRFEVRFGGNKADPSRNGEWHVLFNLKSFKAKGRGLTTYEVESISGLIPPNLTEDALEPLRRGV
jgi:topoisomerase-4 subunit A